MNEIALRMFVGLQTEIASLRSRAQDRLTAEDGAEVVQVVMIMGIMAIIVVALFLTDTVGLKGAIVKLGNTVKDQIGIAGGDSPS